MKSCQKDGVSDTHFLDQAEQPLPNPQHLNSSATVSGMLYLKFMYRVIAVEEFLFEQIKKDDILFSETSDVLFNFDTIP